MSVGTLGNGAFLEEEERQQKLARKARTARAAMTAEQLAAEAAFKKRIAVSKAALTIMNREAPTARLPLPAYQEKMRQAMMAADIKAFNNLVVISKFGWSANTPLGMYRFRVENGKKVYVPFSDADLTNIFAYMAGATNRYGYNRFREPSATCDWNDLRDLYIQRQQTATKQYPPSDWRHVVEIYPGRYICQVYKPSTWVKIRKPLAIAVGAVAVVTLGPAVFGKIGSAFTGGGAAAGTGAAGEAAAAGIVGASTKAGVVTAVTTKAGVTAIATKAGIAATAAAVKVAPSLFTSIQGTANNLLKYYNQGTTIKAVVNGEIPPPPISIEGDNFLDWATKVAIDEVMKEQQRKLTQQEQTLIELEMQRLQAQLIRQIPTGIPAYPVQQLSPQIQEVMVRDKESNASTQDMLIMAAVALGAIVLAKGF